MLRPGGSGKKLSIKFAMLCVNSEEDNNSTGDGSMRDGVNAGDRKVLICFQLVFIKYPTTVLHRIVLCWEF